MQCDYTHLNHNSLVSLKKVITKGVVIKGVTVFTSVGQCFSFFLQIWYVFTNFSNFLEIFCCSYVNSTNFAKFCITKLRGKNLDLLGWHQFC
jgi:hypothetical protein